MELNFFNNKIAVNLSTDFNTKYDKKNIYIDYKFSTFERPKVFNSNNNVLNILLDHNFNINENDNAIIIDHHLLETQFNISYPSNSELMYNTYTDIYDIIDNIIDNFNAVNIYIHADLDGLCSGLMMQHILSSIINDVDGKNTYKSDLNLVDILGNYGDINENAKTYLADFLQIPKNGEIIDIYDKKISSFCTGISRFLKSVRAGIFDINNNNTNNKVDYDIKFKEYNLIYDDVFKTVIDIYNLIKSMKNINTKNTLIFMNILAQNQIINKIIDAYAMESDKLIQNYIEPIIPCMEMNIIFKKDITKTKYKLLIISTPFDCGRSIIWKYNIAYNILDNKVSRLYDKTNKWHYKVTDWIYTNSKDINDIIDEKRNYICYNTTLKKISLNGSCAYTIATNIFNGGGHMSCDDGNSLGSAIIDDENKFYDSFVIIDLF